MTAITPDSHLLRPDDVLAEVDLCSAADERAWGRPGRRLFREGGVRIGRPLVYRLADDELPAVLQRRCRDLGVQYLGALFAFDLLEAPPGRAHSAASFLVRLEDPRCIAVSLNAGEDALDVVLGAELTGAGADEVVEVPVPSISGGRRRSALWARPRTLGSCAQVARVEGLLSSAFSWDFRIATARTTLPGSFTVHVVIEAPDDLEVLTGDLDCRVTVTRSMRGAGVMSQGEASPPDPVQLYEPIVAARASEKGRARSLPDRPVTQRGPRAVRLFVSADIRAYSQRQIDQAERAQQSLVDIMTRAAGATGITDVGVQEQGDCVLLVLPPGVDEIATLPTLYQALQAGVSAANEGRGTDPLLQLRVGMDHGHSGRAAAGWDGQAAIVASRIRDCEQARAAQASGAPVTLTVSDALYLDVVRELLLPPVGDEFTRVEISDPVKGFHTSAWLHVPGRR